MAELLSEVDWPAVEFHRDPSRRQLDLLMRRPFYINLRLGRAQCAMWIGSGYGKGHGSERCGFMEVFNWFPPGFERFVHPQSKEA